MKIQQMQKLSPVQFSERQSRSSQLLRQQQTSNGKMKPSSSNTMKPVNSDHHFKKQQIPIRTPNSTFQIQPKQKNTASLPSHMKKKDLKHHLYFHQNAKQQQSQTVVVCPKENKSSPCNRNDVGQRHKETSQTQQKNTSIHSARIITDCIFAAGCDNSKSANKKNIPQPQPSCPLSSSHRTNRKKQKQQLVKLQKQANHPSSCNKQVKNNGHRQLQIIKRHNFEQQSNRLIRGEIGKDKKRKNNNGDIQNNSKEKRINFPNISPSSPLPFQSSSPSINNSLLPKLNAQLKCDSNNNSSSSSLSLSLPKPSQSPFPSRQLPSTFSLSLLKQSSQSNKQKKLNLAASNQSLTKLWLLQSQLSQSSHSKINSKKNNSQISQNRGNGNNIIDVNKNSTNSCSKNRYSNIDSNGIDRKTTDSTTMMNEQDCKRHPQSQSKSLFPFSSQSSAALIQFNNRERYNLSLQKLLNKAFRYELRNQKNKNLSSGNCKCSNCNHRNSNYMNINPTISASNSALNYSPVYFGRRRQDQSFEDINDGRNGSRFLPFKRMNKDVEIDKDLVHVDIATGCNNPQALQKSNKKIKFFQAPRSQSSSSSPLQYFKRIGLFEQLASAGNKVEAASNRSSKEKKADANDKKIDHSQLQQSEPQSHIISSSSTSTTPPASCLPSNLLQKLPSTSSTSSSQIVHLSSQNVNLSRMNQFNQLNQLNKIQSQYKKQNKMEQQQQIKIPTPLNKTETVNSKNSKGNASEAVSPAAVSPCPVHNPNNETKAQSASGLIINRKLKPQPSSSLSSYLHQYRSPSPSPASSYTPTLTPTPSTVTNHSITTTRKHLKQAVLQMGLNNISNINHFRKVRKRQQSPSVSSSIQREIVLNKSKFKKKLLKKTLENWDITGCAWEDQKKQISPENIFFGNSSEDDQSIGLQSYLSRINNGNK